jgi:hypothetical protein
MIVVFLLLASKMSGIELLPSVLVGLCGGHFPTLLGGRLPSGADMSAAAAAAVVYCTALPDFLHTGKRGTYSSV